MYSSHYIATETFCPSDEIYDNSPIQFCHLSIGDVVILLSSTDSWCFGLKTGPTSDQGIFPGSCVIPLDLEIGNVLKLQTLLSVFQWNSALRNILINGRTVFQSIGESMTDTLRSVRQLKSFKLPLLEINSKLGQPLLLPSVNNFQQSDIVELHKTYDIVQTQVIKRMNGVLPTNEKDNFNIFVDFKPQCKNRKYWIVVFLLDGRSSFPMYQCFSFASVETMLCMYPGITMEDYNRRELSLQLQVFDISSTNQPKVFKGSVSHRFPHCTPLNPEIKHEISLGSENKDDQILMRVFFNGDADDAVVLNRLSNDDDVRSESCICLSFPEGFQHNNDIIIQGDVWYNYGDVMNPGLIVRNTLQNGTVRQFRTRVPSNVKYEETIGINLPQTDTKDLHLRLTFYDEHDNMVGLSYLRIISDGVLLTDGRYELNVYSAESQNEVKNHSYLMMPSLRKNTDMTAAFTNYSLLESDVICCCVCSSSAYLSQNRVLMQFLRANDENDLSGVIPTLCGANPFDFKYMMPQILDKTFFLLRGTHGISQMAFDFLTCVFHWNDSELYGHITDAVNECLSAFRHPSVDTILIGHLKTKFEQFNANPEGAHVKLNLIRVTGCLPTLMEFIIAAKVCDGSDVTSLAADFAEVMALSLKSLTVDTDIGRHIPELAKMVDPLLERGIFDVNGIYEYVENIMLCLPEPRLLARIGFIGNLLKSTLFQLECRMDMMGMIVNYVCTVITTTSICQPKNCELMRLLMSALFDIVDLRKHGDGARQSIIRLFILRCFHPIIKLCLEISKTGFDRNSSLLLMSICDMCDAELWLRYSNTINNSHFCFVDLIEFFSILCEESNIPSSWDMLTCRMYATMLTSLETILSIVSKKEQTVSNYSTIFNVLLKINGFLNTQTLNATLLHYRLYVVVRKLWHLIRSTCQFEEFITFFLSLIEGSDSFFRGLMIRIISAEPLLNRTDEIILQYWLKPVTSSHILFWKEFNNVFHNFSHGMHKHLKVLHLIVNSLFTNMKFKYKDEGLMYNIISTMQLIKLSDKEVLKGNWVKGINYLLDIYVETEQYVEAGKLLISAVHDIDWNDNGIQEHHKQLEFIIALTTFDNGNLKQAIYHRAAEYFERAQLWEMSIEIYKELVRVNETMLYDYDKIPGLMRKLTTLYSNINTIQRMEYHFFLVGFFGDEQPVMIRNKHFILRGHQLELWDQFKSRILRHVGGVLVDVMDRLDHNLTRHPVKMPGRFVSIMPVVQVPSSSEYKLLSTKNPLLSWYYKHNKLSVFELHRPFKIKESIYTEKETSECTTTWIKKYRFSTYFELPDVVPFYQLSTFSILNSLSPVEVAHFNLQEANDKLQYYMLMYKKGFKEFEMALSGQIRGILQADVGGGISNYMKFFESSTVCKEKKEALKSLLHCIRSHISILEDALETSQLGIPESDLIKFMVSNFETYKFNIQEQIKAAAVKLSLDVPPLRCR